MVGSVKQVHAILGTTATIWPPTGLTPAVRPRAVDLPAVREKVPGRGELA
ncbi:hypothetical protein SNARM312S_05701 [Streptomyces narbonensis]